MPEINPRKVLVFTGAGVSAESGVPTFRDTNGLWANYDHMLLASTTGWLNHPEAVLDFYNTRRAAMAKVSPNEAHLAIAALERAYEVVVITQNIDNLHEQAGSTNVLHLHGQIDWAKGSNAASSRIFIGSSPIALGQLCAEGTQLRPDVVWFGETPHHMEAAKQHFSTAAKVLVVGTSLSVQPAAGLLKHARGRAEKRIVNTQYAKPPWGYRLKVGLATVEVPAIVEGWLKESSY